jgi:elongation factor 3
MSRGNVMEESAWTELLAPWFDKKFAVKTMNAMAKAGTAVEVEFHDDAPDPDLYKGGFSLAYGTLTLLRDAKLHLKRNMFYGLLGPNNCGKTTLMREIAREKLEGFPKRSELVTIFVEHEVEEREIA